MRFVLRKFDPEAKAASAILHKQILQLKARLWSSDGGGRARKVTHEGVHVDVHEMLAALDELRPANDEQRHALGQAREIFGKFIETQGSMIRSLASRVPNLLLNVVMGCACALFFGYGILAGANLLRFSWPRWGRWRSPAQFFSSWKCQIPILVCFAFRAPTLSGCSNDRRSRRNRGLILPTRMASARGQPEL